MNSFEESSGIYFIYDGECPMCTKAALALRIKKAYGDLTLINARENLDHPIVLQITELKLDLDEGMVLYDGDHFYHGKEALKLMARYGDRKGLFNLFNKSFFRFDLIARLLYPSMRSVRNWLLARKKVGQIDNLGLKQVPIFQSIFGDSWNELPLVMKKHYANHPYSNDLTQVNGKLDVMCAGPIKWFAALFWLMKGIPPINERNVDVSVDFESDPNSKSFYFNRCFSFAARKPYRFRSRMIQIKDNEVIEIMASRLGWRMNIVWEDKRVKLKHKGYAFCLFGYFIPLPLTMLLGVGNAEEVAIDDNTFDMFVDISHPLWGKIYEYKGRFKTQVET